MAVSFGSDGPGSGHHGLISDLTMIHHQLVKASSERRVRPPIMRRSFPLKSGGAAQVEEVLLWTCLVSSAAVLQVWVVLVVCVSPPAAGQPCDQSADPPAEEVLRS